MEQRARTVNAVLADERRKRLLAAGICVQCGVVPGVEGKTYCAACLRSRADYRKGFNDARKAAGICTQCGRPALPGQSLCADDVLKRQLRRLPISERDIAFAAWLAFDGKCQCCGEQNEGGGEHGWHFDHDHATGKFRGIICCHCNRGLGAFFDKPRLMHNALLYLERRSNAQV